MAKETPAETVRELRSVLVRWAIVLGLLGLFAIWATWRMANASSRLAETTTDRTAPADPVEPRIEYWTCTMDPQVRASGPGDCPICGMELVPKYVGSDQPGLKPAQGAAPHEHEHPESSQEQAWYRCTMPECGDVGSSDPNTRCPVCGMKRERVDTGGASTGEAEVRLSERAQRLAEVETELVQERRLFKRLRSVGRVSYDETRYKMVSAWIGGRIDKLFADFTGMRVSKGDHLVEIYSPELLSAQEEYLQALRSTAATGDATSAMARRSSEQILAAARRKLELLGVTEAQIEAIGTSSQPQIHLVVYAPIGGTILEKKAMEGMYVKTGDPLYTIADLRHLWLLVDLYESDLPWVKPFQEVTVTTRSLPGEIFTGQIVFVDPKVDARTRTVEVRIHVDNPAMRLKPDMWVRAEIRAALTHGGRAAVAAPAGSFACPMHPWETADQAATCPICAMNMVPVESLAEYRPPTDPAAVLSVPRGAVMQTGERALVYVQTAPGVYRGVEVTVGPLAEGDDGREYYPILAGLQVGEPVVTRGNFAIDSQMQLVGKPSLFQASGIGGHQHGSGQSQSPAPNPTTTPASEDSARQALCPVMDGEIDPEVYLDYKGVRIYFCCEPCIAKFEADPAKYIPALPAAIQAKLSEQSHREAGHD